MPTIPEQIMQELPSGSGVEEVVYEGSELILYTKKPEFYRSSYEIIRRLVDKFKKRIQVRAYPSVVQPEEKVLAFIKEQIPKEANIKDIYFEPEFSKVIVWAEKPGLVIGKAGEILAKLKEETLWTPEVRRAPIIDSELIRAIRKMIHREAGYRKKFLHQIGEKIYETPKQEVEYIRVTALGAAREVGRSCFLLSTPQSRILLDCGLGTGATKPFPELNAPEFNIQTLDAVVLSHPHLDHCGMVPYLYEYGFRGPLYCTRPSRDISTLLQLDYIGIMQREGKKAAYSSKAIEEMLKHCITLNFGEVTDITPDMRLTLENAGHILGSSCCHVHIGDGLYNVLYSGDFKYENTKLFDAASTDFTRVEALITEATYGQSEMPRHYEGENALIELIRKAVERGGKIIVPSFAIGRAQDLITVIADSDIDVPVYLDGMLWDATAIHTAYPEFLSRKMQSQILYKGKNPFLDPRLKAIGSQTERREVIESPGPYIVLATSGMLIGGPALEYLKHFAQDEKNMLIFVAYQAEGTLGRKIQKGWRYVPMEGEERGVEMKLEIASISGLSGHSGRSQILAYARNFRTPPRKIIVNHGESTICAKLARDLHKELRAETYAPRVLETIRLR